MADRLIITYDNCSPDTTTLIVVRKDNYDFTMLNKIQGDGAFAIYHYLTGGAELVNTKDMPKKPIGDLDSVPHYRCPTCRSAVVLYDHDNKYPCCQWCGQALLWE